MIMAIEHSRITLTFDSIKTKLVKRDQVDFKSLPLLTDLSNAQVFFNG